MPGAVTKVVFLEARDSPPQDVIELPLGPGGTRDIFIAGAFQPGEPHFGASVEGKDVTVEASWVGGGGSVAGSVDLMVRVRRNANDLSDKARDDFLFALGKLNGIPLDTMPIPGPGRGLYVTDFVAMHVDGASDSEHGDSHFLPWHRLYLLDLERQLQSIVPEVTLPYWRFDEPAPNLFTEDFMGEMDQIPRDITAPGGGFDQGGLSTPLARFAVNNPLSQWQINSTQGIARTARFDPMTEPANGLLQPGGDFGVLDQPATLALGGGSPNPANAHLGSPATTGFARMESTPHGAAHVSFNGPINFVPVAPRDPLFFLLHCNVDRLWAVWQAIFDRDDFADTQAYPYQNPGDADTWEIVNAPQWPWDGSNSEPGSLRAPGTRQNNFTTADVSIGFPGASPTLRDAIDPYDNRLQASYMGFGYDDVPYNHAPPLTN
ncbi:tyrosinase family protein [Phaeobacter sp. 22II1-1F12B]|uniref:tyrosinase family protein n=1 Tax=Phaeobacter sp. 22II1-1F12B TaxID=1317111 RepID=UPI001303AA75|nr:tyrosinase family protein [Phaeobacter sp. 22II1-1F12B]